MLGVLNAHVVDAAVINRGLTAPVLVDYRWSAGSINGRTINGLGLNDGPTSTTVEMEAFGNIQIAADAVLHLDIFFETSDASIIIQGDAALGKLFFGGNYGRRMVLPGEDRTIVVPAYQPECATMSDCCLATYTKDPDDRMDYNVDFGRWLEVDDVIDDALVTLENQDTEILIDEVEVSRQVVRVWLEAGVDGDDSHVEVKATTVDGRTKTACFRIRIEECC